MEDFLKFLLIAGVILVGIFKEVNKNSKSKKAKNKRPVSPMPSPVEVAPDEWMREKKTIREHLDYKFIMTLEGNDVASNLKWVMSSNSLAVMTRPTCETWFMEGTLVAGYHYVEVKEDFSDLPEKLQYYIEHPEQAEDIIRHAHEYVRQFQDKERENLISLMVLDKYFRLSGQQ